MLSRKFVSAAVVVLIACLSSPAGAQNLEAGKSSSQIFSQTCSLCHKSARGLLKTVPPGALSGFLRQHYTTSTDMASMLSAYLLSNGATDARAAGDNLTKQGKEARSGTGPEPKAEAKPESKPEPKPERRTREASRPDVDGLASIPGVPSRTAEPEAPPAEARQRIKKPKQDKQKPVISTVKQEPKEGASTAPPPTATAKTEPSAEPPVRSGPTRPDPVPAVTPAPAVPDAPPQKTAEDGAPNMPVFNLDPPPRPAEVSPPRPPAGPPVVPISQ